MPIISYLISAKIQEYQVTLEIWKLEHYKITVWFKGKSQETVILEDSTHKKALAEFYKTVKYLFGIRYQ